MRVHGITDRARVRRVDDRIQLRVGPHLVSMTTDEARALSDDLIDATEQPQETQ